MFRFIGVTLLGKPDGMSFKEQTHVQFHTAHDRSAQNRVEVQVISENQKLLFSLDFLKKVF